MAVVGGACAAKAGVHLALVDRYGYHGDELYFLECGRRLAFGYVDHPPLIPWLARAADALGGGLLVLRLPAIAAGVGTLWITSLFVRALGGGWRAQLVALLSLLLAPAHLRMGAMLDIPVVEGFLCALVAWLVWRAAATGRTRTWVLAGLALGAAGLAKHSSLAFGAALGLGMLLVEGRGLLRARGPWLGAGAALLVVAPNLAWQFTHGLPTLEFMGAMRRELGAHQGPALFLAGQLLYFHPLAVPVWGAGLVSALRGQRAARPFAIAFLALAAVYVATSGKPYYLASAYPPVLAAGAVALDRWRERAVAGWRALVAALAVTGAGLGLVALPALPLTTVDSVTGALFGWAVRPIDLTHDLHAMYGWREHAAAIDHALASLPEPERGDALVLAGTYSQAAALNRLRRPGAPRAVSGHMTYHLWGPGRARAPVLVAYGVPLSILERHYARCAEVGRVDAPLARPHDTDLSIHACREPLDELPALWADVRRYRQRWDPPGVAAR